MGLLPWSFGFLLIFSLLLWTQLKTMTETSILHEITFLSVDAAGERLGVAIEQRARHSQRKESHHSDSPRDFHGLRTSKLHLDDFFRPSNDPRHEAQRKIFFRLVEILYGNQPIFSKGDNRAAVIALFEKVCKKGEELATKSYFHKVEDLALINLREDPSIPNFEHKAFYHMLRGGSGELIDNTPCTLEGLQNYISLHSHPQTILSVYLAPKNLLLALYGPGKEDVVAEILVYREELWKELCKKKGKNNKATLEEDFSLKFKGQLPSDIPANFIDFRISSSRPRNSPKMVSKKRLKRSFK